MTETTKGNLLGFTLVACLLAFVYSGLYFILIKPANDFEDKVAQVLTTEENCDEVWQQGITYYCLKGDAVKEFHFAHHNTSVKNIQKEYDCKYGKDRKAHNRFVELTPDRTICYNLMAKYEDNRS